MAALTTLMFADTGPLPTLVHFPRVSIAAFIDVLAIFFVTGVERLGRATQSLIDLFWGLPPVCERYGRAVAAVNLLVSGRARLPLKYERQIDVQKIQRFQRFVVAICFPEFGSKERLWCCWSFRI